MGRIDFQKTVVLYLAWLGALSAALVVSLSDALPLRLSFVRPDNLFAAFLMCRVFFAVFLWPLFIPWIAPRPGWGLLLPVGVLAALALPPAVVCADVSDAGWAALARGEALVAALAALAAAIFSTGCPAPWYFLGAFTLSALAPFVSFMAREFGGADLDFLALASPFWGAYRVDGGVSLAQAGAYAVVAAVLWLAFKVDAPDPAG